MSIYSKTSIMKVDPKIASMKNRQRSHDNLNMYNEVYVSSPQQQMVPQIDLSLLHNLNADNYDNRKLHITRKLDNLIDQNKQKEETLKALER